MVCCMFWIFFGYVKLVILMRCWKRGRWLSVGYLWLIKIVVELYWVLSSLMRICG